MPHASIANRRRINLQKLTPDGNVIWSRNIMLANWPVRRNYETVTDCCDNDHTAAGSKLRSNSGLEVQATDDGGCLLIVERARLSGESYQPCRAAIVRIDDCGCVLWERHYGSGHDVGPYVPNTGKSGSPQATYEFAEHMNGLGRIAVCGEFVFVLLSGNKVEKLSLETGEWLSATEIFWLGSWIEAGIPLFQTPFGDMVIGDRGGSGFVICGYGMQQHYTASGDLSLQRLIASPWLETSTEGNVPPPFSRALLLDASANGVLCSERGYWSGLSVRLVSPPAGLIPFPVPVPYVIDPDAAIVSSTFDPSVSTVNVLATSNYYNAACFDPSGQIYAASLNGATGSEPAYRKCGLQKLSPTAPMLSESWYIDVFDNSFGIIGFLANRLVADSTGVYAVGNLSTAGSTFGVWKHSSVDGSLLWYYATPLHSDGAFDPKSLCLDSDGNLFVCGDESQF
jgi:hypothetical protein